jgi:hypothetical protein
MREIFGRFRPRASSIEMQPVRPITTLTPDIQKTDTPPKTPDNNTRETLTSSLPRATPTQDTDSDVHLVRKDAQPGVQKIEATTQVWSKKHLLAAYVM